MKKIIKEIDKEINKDFGELMEKVIDVDSYIQGLEKAKEIIYKNN